MRRVRTVRNHTMKINGTPEEIFPLLCPVREKDWIQPWRCEMVFSMSGFAELDCVFRTDFPDDGPEDTWVVSKYEPPFLIEFVRVNPLRCMRYEIRLDQPEGCATSAAWKQVTTGLTPEGDRFVSGQSEEAYAKQMETLERLLNNFLQGRKKSDPGLFA